MDTGARRSLVQDFDLAARKARINIKNDPKLRIRRGMGFAVSLLAFIGVIYSTYHIICWQVEKDIVSDEARAIDTSLGHEVDSLLERDKKEKDLLTVETITKMTHLREEAAAAAKQNNSQTKAWLTVKGTNIDYPVVQSSDNSFYLNHSYTGAPDSSGWVFMDFEDDPNFGSQNTVIYAHGRNEGTMFGTLKNALNADWQNNPDNHIVVTATEKNTFFWKVFSVYRIPNTNDYITVNYSSKNNFQRFIDTVKSRSVYNFNTDVSADDRVLTLSTCIGSDDRMVLHAVLIETVNK